ncbi:hypothetical protein ABT369_28960 [Dactylosporangium sp. NPDC000244]|uniref:hypothetical protein n=1 Tax=Dactylosporangium sp. NPDC000244 TaxID=3154365 RepID=UPI00332C8961
MGVIYDYFAADSDEQAAAALDLPGGPGGPDGHDGPVVSCRIDPAVRLGELARLFAGVDRSSGAPIAATPDFDQLVLPISPDLRAALAAATPAELDAVAEPWSRIEEFDGGFAPPDAAEFLHSLAEVSRAGKGLYCWICI